MHIQGRQAGAMKRFAIASIFMGFAVSAVLTLAIGGVSGSISRENWVTGHAGQFPLALVGVFAVLGIAMTFVIDYFLSRQNTGDD